MPRRSATRITKTPDALFAFSVVLMVLGGIAFMTVGQQSDMVALAGGLALFLAWASQLLLGPLVLFLAWREPARIRNLFFTFYFVVACGAGLVTWAMVAEVPQHLEDRYDTMVHPEAADLREALRQRPVDPERVQRILAGGIDVNRPDARGDTYLLRAVSSGDVGIAGLLLDAGADPNLASESGQRPLSRAIRHRHFDTAALLLQSGADANASDDSGQPPLCTLLSVGATAPIREMVLDALVKLLEAGAQSSASCAGRTPIEIAMTSGRWDAVQAFLDFDPAEAKRGINRLEAGRQLLLAIESGDRRRLDLLLRAGVHPDAGATRERTALVEAVRTGDDGLVERLLESGADPRKGPLVGAVIELTPPRPDLLERFLAAGAPVDVSLPGRPLPLEGALRQRRIDVVRRLLEAGADPDHSRYADRPLLLRVQRDQQIEEPAEYVAALIQARADPNVTDDDRRTPLMIAAMRGSARSVARLLAAGARIDAVDRAGRSALWHAAQASGGASIIESLARHGADPDHLDERDVSPGCAAAQRELIDNLLAILQAGGTLGGCGRSRETLMVTAIGRDNAAMLRALIDHGIDPDTRDQHGTSLLEHAAYRYRLALVDLLLERGASPETDVLGGRGLGTSHRFGEAPSRWRPPQGADPAISILAAAALGGYYEMVERLLAAGADPDRRMINGMSALHIAAVARPGTSDVARVVERIARAGADLTRSDDDGCTPLTHACRLNRVSQIEAYTRAGADFNQVDAGGRTPVQMLIEHTHSASLLAPAIDAGAHVTEADLEHAMSKRKTNMARVIDKALRAGDG